MDFFLREAASDVSGALLLAEFASSVETQIDFSLSAGAALAVVEEFVSSPAKPGKAAWDAGAYTLTLEIVNAATGYTAELWRADSAGADIAQVGARPAVQTGKGTKTFSFTGAAQEAAKADRLKVKVLAQNSGAGTALFSFRASASKLDTPLTTPKRFARPALERGKFLGRVPRPAERVQVDPDGFEV